MPIPINSQKKMHQKNWMFPYPALSQQKPYKIILKNINPPIYNTPYKKILGIADRMKGSRLDEWLQFIEYEKQRMNMKLSPLLQAMMDNCEYILHTEFDKNSKSKVKHKKRKQELSKEYREAFKEFSRDEKLAYYLRYMKFITEFFQGKDRSSPALKGMISTEVFIRSFNLKMWKQKKIRLDREKHIIYAENDNKIKTYVLEDYILRKSKNKDYYCFVLDAINNKPHEKSMTVHIGFKDEGKFNQWFKEVDSVIAAIQWNLVVSQLKDKVGKGMTQSAYLGRASDVASQKNSVEEPEEYLSKSVFVQSKTSEIAVQQKQQQKKVRDPDSFVQEEFADLKNNQQQFYSSGQDQHPVDIKKSRQTIIEQIAKMDDLDQIQAITSREQKKVITSEVKENIFARIMPQYNLGDIANTINYGSLYDEGNIRILGHLEQGLKIKMFLKLPADFSQKLILNALTQSQASKQQNPQIEQVSLKTLIKSQNSAMMYLKIKAFNKLYRPRDFIFLRHVFLAHQIIYIIDKSIENVSYPPFTTIVRGDLCILWAIKKEEDKNMVIADINMNNQGYLNDAQNANLVLKYFKGFANIEKIIRNKKPVLENVSLFNDKWNIVEEQPKQSPEKTNNNKSSYRKQSINSSSQDPNGIVAFKKKKEESTQKPAKNGVHKQIIPQKSTSVVLQKQKSPEVTKQKIQNVEKELKLKQKYSHMEQQKGEIDQAEAEKKIEKIKHWAVAHGIKRDFDQNGHVIISKSFIRTKYLLSPLPKKPTVFQEAVKGHPIWKGQWIHDDKVGGIIFVNQKKIQDQKGVLKFILTKIGKNLLSGKSVLNISLPVDIFCAESNLQRLLYSLTYAPTHLQPAVKNKNPMQRLKKVIAFGISNSPLYLNMEKPFNPILGETFQCWIDGCPAYAQQISHHPPIAALLYQGRGFRMTAQLESKVELHMNSGCGTNEGVFRIKFEDGMEACYITPGGQVSGLAYGDRKFNMVGKSYYWIESESLFLELVFNPTRKGFFSVGKQNQPTDYFEGYICKVKPEFMEHFHKKKKPPTQKQILQKRGRVHGIWNKYVQYEEQTLLDIDKEFPAVLEYQANPLPSDANWREDIAYRRILEISRAQSEKQRLQVFQRKDRKLRQANPNHHHHKK